MLHKVGLHCQMRLLLNITSTNLVDECIKINIRKVMLMPRILTTFKIVSQISGAFKVTFDEVVRYASKVFTILTGNIFYIPSMKPLSWHM